ncbi:hypothetical protein ACQUWN_23100 [Rossellomorea aquimaris]|uniref:hypothetical protein n=1 Tax=Rossellomorea TaxID=2837508 RepID=UPI001653878B|nr:hypothetical protein [Rossellomorea vietnamensis]
MNEYKKIMKTINEIPYKDKPTWAKELDKMKVKERRRLSKQLTHEVVVDNQFFEGL